MNEKIYYDGIKIIKNNFTGKKVILQMDNNIFFNGEYLGIIGNENNYVIVFFNDDTNELILSLDCKYWEFKENDKISLYDRIFENSGYKLR